MTNTMAKPPAVTAAPGVQPEVVAAIMASLGIVLAGSSYDNQPVRALRITRPSLNWARGSRR